MSVTELMECKQPYLVSTFSLWHHILPSGDRVTESNRRKTFTEVYRWQSDTNAGSYVLFGIRSDSVLCMFYNILMFISKSEKCVIHHLFSAVAFSMYARWLFFFFFAISGISLNNKVVFQSIVFGHRRNTDRCLVEKTSCKKQDFVVFFVAPLAAAATLHSMCRFVLTKIILPVSLFTKVQLFLFTSLRNSEVPAILVEQVKCNHWLFSQLLHINQCLWERMFRLSIMICVNYWPLGHYGVALGCSHVCPLPSVWTNTTHKKKQI